MTAEEVAVLALDVIAATSDPIRKATNRLDDLEVAPLEQLKLVALFIGLEVPS